MEPASELKNRQLTHLCQPGGWKEPTTVLTCYIKPDEATMREALAERTPLGEAATSYRTYTTNLRHRPNSPTVERPARAISSSGALSSRVWAWVELNYRPHAYQTANDFPSSPASCRIS